jgi:hypothetical protein
MPEERDPFDGITFDDAFVRDADRREETADERVKRWQRIDAEHRRIVEAARQQIRDQDLAVVHPTLVPPAPRRRRWWPLAVVAVLVVPLLWVSSRSRGDEATAPRTPSIEATDSADERRPGAAIRLEGGQPSVPADARTTPLGQPAPLPAGGGPFQFVAEQPDGSGPVAYDPCRPIHLVVNPRTAPPGGDAVLDESLARVSEATGLQFVVDGPTTERPIDERRPYQPERYQDRWAPVLVAWSDPGESEPLEGDVAGQGGSSWIELPNGSLFVTGTVVLDGPDIARMLETATGRAVARGVLQHELAHLVGLDHVGDPSQLMYPRTSAEVTDFAAGDLHGLARLGRGSCFPNV